MKSEDIPQAERIAVERALKLRPDKTDRYIAEHSGVSHATVAKARAELSGQLGQMSTRTVQHGGTTYQQDTGAIATANRERAERTREQEESAPPPGKDFAE